MISNEMSKNIETCGEQVDPSCFHRPSHESPDPCNSPDPHDPSQSPPQSDSLEQEPRAVNICIEAEWQQDKNNLPNTSRDITSRGAEKNRRVASPLIEDLMDRPDNGTARGARNDVRAKQAQGLQNISQYAHSSIDLVPVDSDRILPLELQLKNLRVAVNLPDEENLKEQISPKENKDEGDEKSKHSKDRENAGMEKLLVQIDNVEARQKTPKPNDVLNQVKQNEPARPLANSDFDEIDFVRLEKERMRQLGLAEKFKKKKKKNRRNNRSNSGEDGQDFDSLYRLPTEHLTRHRNGYGGKDRNVRSVEDQLRLHEELNERRKLAAEMEREHIYGAVGGFPDIEETVVTRERAVTFEGGNVSPTSEHSRDSSPTNEDVNIRRFDR